MASGCLGRLCTLRHISKTNIRTVIPREITFNPSNICQYNISFQRYKSYKDYESSADINEVIGFHAATRLGERIELGDDHLKKGSKKIDIKQVWEKYEEIKVAYDEISIPDVDPNGIFANNELDLSEINVYGFDYDYTLAVYKASLHDLIYDLGKEWLVNKFKYPKEIAQMKFVPNFAIRGLHFDKHEGVLMKIDCFHQIQYGSVYRGLKPISKSEIIRLYGGSYIPQSFIRAPAGADPRMQQLNDLFSVPEICLLSQVTDFFESNGIMYQPEILFQDVQNAIRSIHPVMHRIVTESNIHNYLEKQPELLAFLTRLRANDKKTFLITNSPFKFVDIGMRYMIGSNWQDLFDIIVVMARKPKFFTDHNRPFRIYDPVTKSQEWKRVTRLSKGQIYIEGTLSQLQEMTGWYGSSVLYFGDQIYSDLADLTLHHGWRTGAIIFELADEIKILNSENFKHTVCWLQTLQHLIEELQENKKNESSYKNLLEEREQLQMKTKMMFNDQFGSIFRTHHNPTYFSRRLFRYSDIYMAQVTHLLGYSLHHTFYPRRGLLPHESKIPLS